MSEKLRKIVLVDGTTMGDCAIVFNTNAPVKLLKDLEKKSCDVYKKFGPEAYNKVPNWAEVCFKKGYTFEFVGDHQHVTAYGTSRSWLEENYPDVTEKYVIENQPE